MPELPEVETTKSGLVPFVLGQTIESIEVKRFDLRWPINADIERRLQGQSINGLSRRSKYLLWQLDQGYVISHLGMSGLYRVLQSDEPWMAHEHFELLLQSGVRIRYRDPRRFGAFLWTEQKEHPLLNKLGPEPLGPQFDADYLFQKLRQRKSEIKPLLMNASVVVGVGNIYASESLFLAEIRPQRKASGISYAECIRLVDAVRDVLTRAIEQGGTTLKDFAQVDTKPGYFAQKLHVYGREGQSCARCGQVVAKTVQAGRASFFCAGCQH